MRVTITQDKIDKARIIAPGKYVCLVADYEEDMAKKDGSTLHIYTLKVCEGREVGAEIRFMVSEKLEEMGYPFWEACGFTLTPGANLDPASFKGKKVGVYNQRGEYNGKPQNMAVDFFKVGTSEASATAAVAE